MKKIELLGTGCPKCQKLYTVAELAAKSSGVEFNLEKVTDIEKIVASGVMATPALSVDGKVLSMGRVPSQEEITRWIQE